MLAIPHNSNLSSGAMFPSYISRFESSGEPVVARFCEEREIGTRGFVRSGWSFAENACELDDKAAHGYARGVPMSSDLSAGLVTKPAGAAPQLFVSAIQDPHAAHLQKLQVIKGWIDDAGQARYKVFDVADQENSAGETDLQTGEWSGSGSTSLCAVFEDPEFDPSEASYYYLRVVEVPTLRWSWAQCVALSADERPDACDNNAPKTVQEMAWTSPIWYLPPE